MRRRAAHSRPYETARMGLAAAAAVLHGGAAGPPFVGAHIMRPRAAHSRPCETAGMGRAAAAAAQYCGAALPLCRGAYHAPGGRLIAAPARPPGRGGQQRQPCCTAAQQPLFVGAHIMRPRAAHSRPCETAGTGRAAAAAAQHCGAAPPLCRGAYHAPAGGS